MIAGIVSAFLALPLVIQIIIIIALVGVPSYAFYAMVIVPGQEVAGAAADLATKAASVGGQILDVHGNVIKGTTEAAKKAGEAVGKAGKAVAKAATKKCRPGFEKVGLDCLVKCPYGTSGLYCKKKEYKLGKYELDTYKVSKAKHACKPGYTKLKFPRNKTCRKTSCKTHYTKMKSPYEGTCKETSCKPGYTRLKFPKADTCQSACPKYTEKDFTGGCKRKPERHWF